MDGVFSVFSRAKDIAVGAATKGKDIADRAVEVAQKHAQTAGQVVGDVVLKTADTLGVKSHVEVH